MNGHDVHGHDFFYALNDSRRHIVLHLSVFPSVCTSHSLLYFCDNYPVLGALVSDFSILFSIVFISYWWLIRQLSRTREADKLLFGGIFTQ